MLQDSLFVSYRVQRAVYGLVVLFIDPHHRKPRERVYAHENAHYDQDVGVLILRGPDPAPALVLLPVTTVSSTKVFHSLHAGHCPSHFADSKPQLLQKNTVRFLAFAIYCLLYPPKARS